ncbi:Exonuclease RNase T and DNA polymerase III [Beutenbergia cavernae DSM 12333]|uniref:Oligoribonuclease n=1 Tax=Beutenbergia cavernae (strain ATCC BAA-8 / DSM 12333 / CCUG 43141 / JCM 11478 / NBRC 16432 / NCIMB 13614 / HKI 0122) TaxID=471853 RepID=C5BXL7_BEUC1|nr:oligoribonuclease [Beutenbergia cavernae]ACQ80900.1 Exonuclease RNase T and DNA polymerase III [Beutenbergia cavernae DSM 12333]
MSQPSAKDPIVWIDCEMTGLDLATDALVEVAVIVTDSELHPLDGGIDVVIAPPPGALEAMGDVVREMHTTSGLLDELAGGVELAEAHALVLDYVRRLVPDPRRAPLAGNSVGTDRGFLERDMPDLVGHLHYRIIDVSSIKELARRWYPRVYFNSPPKAGGHRALADIAESIDELRYYRAALFPGEPGPDSATVKKVAARVTRTPTAATLAPPAEPGVAGADGVDAVSGTGPGPLH